jgi:hypothetical protein
MRAASGETWQQYRRRIIRETERFIEWGLAHPDEVIEIPMKPASEGGFPRKVGEWFWTTVLTSRPTAAARWFRGLLARRPRGLFRRR